MLASGCGLAGGVSIGCGTDGHGMAYLERVGAMLGRTKFGKTWFCHALAAGLLVIGLSGQVLAQDGEGDGDRWGGDRQRMDWRNMSEEERAELRERMQERMAEREQQRREQVREQLGMSAEEFAAISPTIEKIRRLTAERMIATRMGDFARRRGGPGGEGAGEGPRLGGWGRSEMTAEGQALASSMAALRTALRDEQASADDVKAKLAALRAARDKLDQALAAARAELRGVLLARQEAMLVLQGVLD